jgi:hypothetical protein
MTGLSREHALKFNYVLAASTVDVGSPFACARDNLQDN